jgi:hypothetical protein
VYDAFTPDDRELFLTCKRSLSPDRLNTLTEEAVEWLSEQAHGDPNAFSYELLRDRVDELVLHEVPDGAQREYEPLFRHLYVTWRTGELTDDDLDVRDQHIRAWTPKWKILASGGED